MALLTNYYRFHWVIKFFLYSLICFALLLILYKFQNTILNNRIIEKLISLTSLTYYKFWRRYNINSDSNNVKP